MGEVYLAQDTRLGRRVALKLLPPEVATEPVRRRRFERESRVLAAINHPHIVTVHAVEELEGQLVLVMELIEGDTLSSLISGGALAVDRALEIALPMSRAVAAAHAAGIVHRDLKPGNVMVRKDGLVKVVDFGLSKMEPLTMAGGSPEWPAEELTQDGSILGTVHYMAPEQLEGRPATPRSDVFSLGVILYEMVGGSPPFVGDSPMSVASAILRDAPLPLPVMSEGVEPALGEAVLRCLAKDPPTRFADAGELCEALASIARERDVRRLLSATGAQPTASSPRRRRQLAVAAVVAAVAGAASWWAMGREPRTLDPPPALGSGREAWLASVPAEAPRIAVLPMRNLSGDAGQDYLAEGATEALIANLAKIRELRVISHDSVRVLRPMNLSVDAAAQRLDVVYAVTGSVVREGGEVAMVLELVAPGRGESLWGDTFRGTLAELFEFYPRVAAEVVRVARIDLPDADARRLARHPAVSDEAYDLYLQGLHQLAERRPESIQRAVVLFREAAAAGPELALAWSGLAEAYWRLGGFGTAVASPAEVLPLAEEAARRALAIDAELSEGWAALGSVLFHLWRWQEAETALRRAVALNPSSADARLNYTQFLTAQGRHREAKSQVREAVALAPLTKVTHHFATSADYFAGDHEEAIARGRRRLELDQRSWADHLQLGESLSQLGRFDEAEHALGRAVELSAGSPFARTALALCRAAAGHPELARETLDDLEEEMRIGYVAPSLLAKLAFASGDRDRGFHYLSQALAEGDSLLTYVAVDPHYRSVRADPRFRQVVTAVGLLPVG
jgi:eukaryotic-like serine/threonine-protein kinase